MSITPKTLDDAAEMLKAIAHPIRIAIITLLHQKNSLTVTVIHETLKIEQAVASHHLRLLKNKHVVQVERKGKNCYYSLKFPRLHQIVECVSQCHKK